MSLPSTSTSKRNSFTNSGPRPLHLVDRNVLLQPLEEPETSCSPRPELPIPSPGSKNINHSKLHPFRRQSSISYHARDSDTVLSPTGPRRALTRSTSVGYKSPRSAGSTAEDGKRTGSNSTTEKERQPHTLAEKHSELLHSIAQKESICLELRAQLATHEAELIQLKRKWEGIVNFGFNKTNSSGHYAAAINGQGSGAMLEGIKEGVRLIAAGLGEFSSPVSPSLSRSATQGHITHHSNSSISTYATKSTRFSQSSASSLGDNSPSSGSPTKEDAHVQVLMVHDTGATPTMSPNFRFAHRQQQQETREKQDREDDMLSNTRLERGAKASETAAKLRHRLSLSPSRISQFPSASEPSPNSPPSTASASMKPKNRANRTSVYGNTSAGLPPASSIPSLGSLAVGVGAAPHWVGKKWEELQNGSTFSNSQKRASGLLLDVSQTIVSALSSPPLTSSYSPMSPTPPPSSSIHKLQPLSLLDEDNDPSNGTAYIMDPTVTTLATVKGVSPQGFDDEWNW